MIQRPGAAVRPRLLIALACLAALAAWAPGAHAQQAQQQKVLDLYNEVVCWLNTEKISKRDVESRMPEVMYRLEVFRHKMMGANRWDKAAEAEYRNNYIPAFREQLRNLVRERLMLQEAKRQSMEIDKERFRKQYESMIGRLRERGVLHKPGYTPAEVREMVEENLMIDQFQGSLVTALDLPNRRQVREYYEKNKGRYQAKPSMKIRQITVSRFLTDALGSKQVNRGAYQKLADLREEVTRYGADFKELAKDKSDDEATRKDGGLVRGPHDEEYIDIESNPLIAHQIAGLKNGEVSKIFESADSWCMVKLIDRREAGAEPLAKIYDKIFDEMSQKLSRDAEEKWFKKTLRSSLILDASRKPIPLSFFFPDDEEILAEERAKAEKEAKAEKKEDKKDEKKEDADAGKASKVAANDEGKAR